MQKLLTLANCLWGYVLKFAYDLNLLGIPKLGDKEQVDIVVSMTSYGRRVSTCVVYYTLASLLQQTVHPRRLILWLSEAEWSDSNLPKKILELKNKGVEIKYCKDIRSYKKLIPTLSLGQEYNIVTVDDDLIYSSDTLQALYDTHLKYPSDIICLNASLPIISSGIPVSYEKWKPIKISQEGYTIFPVGVGGVLYPLGSLHADVMREDLFIKLCPLADDIWFWFNGLRRGTVKRFICKRKRNYSFDDIYQYFHKGSALTHSNCVGHQNNDQFSALFENYDVKILDDRLVKEKKN